MSLQDKVSISIPKGFQGIAGNLAAWNPNGLSGAKQVDLSVVRATTATRVNESGLIESVAANVPRRDFTNGGCGDLLVEPQRTNLEPNSNNSSTGFTQVNTTFLASQSESPDGTTNAASITETTANNNHYYGDLTNMSVVSGTTYTFSVFLKKGNGATAPDIVQLTFNFAGFGATYANFNINNGTVGTTSAVTATISPLVNGYYKCSITATATSNASTGGIIAFTNNNDGLGRLPTYTGSTTSNLFYYGINFESGNYPTSYIPTSGSAVTRNADVISGTGLAALLGDSAGGIYVNASWFDTSSTSVIGLSSGTTNNRVNIYTASGNSNLDVVVGGIVSASSAGTTLSNNTFAKLACIYALNNFRLYQNGSSVVTDTSGNTFSAGTLTDIQFNLGNGIISPFYGRIRELVIFNEAPDDTQLAAITTP